MEVVPDRKRNVVRSQNQALSKISKGMEDLAVAQIKRTKLMIEGYKKRISFFLNTTQMKRSEPVIKSIASAKTSSYLRISKTNQPAI